MLQYILGGSDGSGNAQDDTSEWNGTSFYVGGLMPANRSSHCQAGTQNTICIWWCESRSTIYF